MIGRIIGEVVAKDCPFVTIMTQGGVGYDVALVLDFFAKSVQGALISVETLLVIKDDAHTLYGFENLAQKRLFARLIRVSGVGAKMAHALLSSMSVTDLVAAISAGDEKTLTRVPGVGKKLAGRLCLELQDTLSKSSEALGLSDGLEYSNVAQINNAKDDAIMALLGLGYKKAEIDRALDGLVQTDTQSLLKAALARLVPF